MLISILISAKILSSLFYFVLFYILYMKVTFGHVLQHLKIIFTKYIFRSLFRRLKIHPLSFSMNTFVSHGSGLDDP